MRLFQSSYEFITSCSTCFYRYRFLPDEKKKLSTQNGFQAAFTIQSIFFSTHSNHIACFSFKGRLWLSTHLQTEKYLLHHPYSDTDEIVYLPVPTLISSVSRLIIFRLKKALKITGISLVSLVSLLFISPYLFPDTISKGIQKWVNKNIKGEVKFDTTSLTFFRHFPSHTLSLQNFTLKGSAPFEKDTLLFTKDISFRVNLSTIFSEQIKIDQIS